MNAMMGQYYPTDSVIHKLDARVKIILIFLFLGFVFISKTIYGNLISFFFLYFFIALSKVPFNIIIRSLKPLLFIIIFSFITNTIFVPEGEVIYKIAFIKITEGGLKFAVKIVFRLFIMIISSSMLTFTTSTLEFADGIESILTPLKKVKFPAHEVSMMITIALRFIPTIIEETDKIKKAQMSRGADFETGSIIKRIKNFIPILIPLFVSSFKRADDLSMAMEARCYRGDLNRTKLKAFKLKKIDYTAIFIALIYFTIILLFRFMVEK